MDGKIEAVLALVPALYNLNKGKGNNSDQYPALKTRKRNAETWWDKTPGWSAFYGFVSCIFLIFIVKFIGHIWLYKKEDYYD